MTKKQRLQEEWQDFEKAVVPKNASALQKQEMRRAFYAGALIMFSLTRGLGSDDISEDEAFEVFGGLEQELKEFHSNVGIKY
ncbi:MAG: hypothetical protein RMZ41_003140 [Nostoc sp. DedVER02]|uniref:hypothetical protein n=1 Tax=unclassified Nostoc TaxID=2593658 RepID=UPI002AD455BD|nr:MULTISPECIES: hypothetical protein [unclassified Nostoc]MDZ7986849.1 hypothetical protein [Nostoc sp. DedVER02]MDZ8115751.1 hypothetical protein [Nostoc sp. DedVER01b]